MANETSRSIVISNPQGLHLRPAHGFVALASKFASKIRVSRKDGEVVDGKSILSLITLGAAQGTELTVRAEGADAVNAVNELAEYLEGLSETDIDPPSAAAN